jgi:NAD(P)-dependent dehydrogenase (short-subunit alcohol dehydrogenase family)
MQEPYDLFSLQGKVILITGGNKGIGLALATGMAKAGAKIVIANRGKESGEEAVKTIKDVGGAAVYFQADLAEPAKVTELIPRTIEQFGRIDVLINNVSARINKFAEDHTLEDWEYILRVNIASSAMLAQAAAMEMKKQGGGKIIYISSNLSQRTIDRRSSYGATKGALESLTRQQALEWSRYGIYVNALAPGSTETLELKERMRSDKARYEMVRQMIPLGRPAEPKDMLGMGIFLSSAASDYVTGQTYLVDGGWSIASLPSSVVFSS